MKLRWKVFWWNTAVIAGVGGILLTTIYFIVGHKIRKEFYQFLSDEYQETESLVRATGGDPMRMKDLLEKEVQGIRYFPVIIRVYDADKDENVVVAATESDWLNSLPHRATLPLDGHSRNITVSDRNRRMSDFLGKFEWDSEKGAVTYFGAKEDDSSEPTHFLVGQPAPKKLPHLFLQVGLSDERVRSRITSLRRYMAAGFVLMVVLAAIGGFVLSTRVLTPLEKLSKKIENVAAQNISSRLPLPAEKDEVSNIIRSVNRMLGRIQQKVQQMKEFTANAAHELRTPLTTARCQLEIIMQKESLPPDHSDAIAEALQDLSGLSDLITSLLLLSQLDARPDSYNMETVELGSFIRDTAEFFELSAEQKNITFTLSTIDECYVRANPKLLKRLWSNLLENSLKHSSPGDQIHAQMEDAEQGIYVTVRNSGSVIPEDQITKIFQRFHQTDPSADDEPRKNFGLGLSICRKIAEIHDGMISARSNPDEGTTLQVYLPTLTHDIKAD